MLRADPELVLKLSEPTFIFWYYMLKVAILLQEVMKSWTKGMHIDSSSYVCSDGTAALLDPSSPNVVAFPGVRGDEVSKNCDDNGISVGVHRPDTKQRVLSVASEFRCWLNQETMLML